LEGVLAGGGNDRFDVPGPRQPRNLVSSQIVNRQLPDAASQEHPAQALDRGPVKPHAAILRAAGRRCNHPSLP